MRRHPFGLQSGGITTPIPFKFDSCEKFATNLNASNSLGLGSKKCSKHFTLNNTYRFLKGNKYA